MQQSSQTSSLSSFDTYKIKELLELFLCFDLVRESCLMSLVAGGRDLRPINVGMLRKRTGCYGCNRTNGQ